MCGIWALLSKTNHAIDEATILETYKKIVHRGPDCSNLHHLHRKVSTSTPWKLLFGFHRLAIIDTSCQSDQPLYSRDKTCTLICNGEIFNYQQLIKDEKLETVTASDCESILHLYQKYGIQGATQRLDAEFAFTIYDDTKQQLHIARDRFGVRPLFWAFSNLGNLYISSEAKGINNVDDNGVLIKVEPFPPGCTVTIQLDYIDISTGEIVPFSVGDPEPFVTWNNKLSTYSKVLDREPCENIQKLLIQAVKKRLMSDRPLGCLLSGGVDSSLVTAITWNLLSKQERENFHCFSIGLEGSVDLAAAEIVAKYLGIQHHHIVKFSVEEGLQALEKVIYHLETYDVTTIRASVPQYLLAKYVGTQTQIRVLLSGEGADELFGGYQYFKQCPTASELQVESRRLLDELYLYDNLRTDRTTAAWGLEVRVPFLDRDLVEYVDSLDPELRMCSLEKIEKHLLRSSFVQIDKDGNSPLPDSILWRRKEAFSDAVSSRETSWYKSLQKHLMEKEFGTIDNSEDILRKGQSDYLNNPPPTLEALAYRKIFERVHPGRSNLIPRYWMPRWVKLEQWDPSATVLECHAGDLKKLETPAISTQ